MEFHEWLGVDRAQLERHRDRFERRTYEGLTYEHLPGYRGALHKGVVLVEEPETVVDGFPKVPRTLVLETGVPRQFEGEVVIEEKLDGYNVRVARVGERVLAFTRSGIVCPFTTRKVRKLLPVEALFADHPDVMLCGEMVGPENPYTACDYPEVESLAFRAFDVRDRESGEPMGVADRRALCEEYGIEQVPLHDRVPVEDAPEAVADLLPTLEREGREGVVMKSPTVDRQLKYTTSHANRGDLAYAFSLPFDYGQAFMFRRLIREAFQSVEFEEDDEQLRQRADELGEAILEPMVETVREVREEGIVGERHTVRGEDETVEALLEHLRDQGLRVEVERDERADGQRVVEFLKVTRATTDKTRDYLEGRIATE